MKFVVVILAIVLLLIVPSAAAQGSWTINRHVIGAGGVTGTQLMATLGQPVAGRINQLCSGFWHGCTAATVTTVGLATLTARYTFGQIGIGVVILFSVVLMTTRNIYDLVRQLWDQRRSRSRPAQVL